MGNKQTTTAGLTEGPYPEGMEKEAFFGLDNFGATCYLNSVMQALYASTLLRGKILDYFESLEGPVDEEDESLLHQVAELFYSMTHGDGNAGEKLEGKLLTGSLAPQNLYKLVLHKNDLFMRHQQQDAQEFLIFMLNTLTEELIEIERKKRRQRRSSGELMEQDQKEDASSSDDEEDQPEIVTWIQEIFGGKLINETQCLRCENVQDREEDFMDLSLQIPGSVSLNECLRKFSHATLLNESNKYECLKCRCKQEAFSRMRIKTPPQVLVIHLKRFKYIEEYRSFKKLFDRVEYPFDLKLINTIESPSSDFIYHLLAVVIHIGDGPRMGHYQAMVKRLGHWYLYDDEYISLVSEDDVRDKFGGTRSTAYLLFYER